MEPKGKKIPVKQKRIPSIKKPNSKKSIQGDGETSKTDSIECNEIKTTAIKSKVVKMLESAPKIYIRFKKSIRAMSKTSEDLIAMHPLIKSVRLPRQKESSKFFFAICQSEANALKAAKELQERKDCFVKPAFKVSQKGEKKPVATKPKLRDFWQ